MAFESQNIIFQTKKLLCTNQFAVGATMLAKPEKPIKKVLFASAKAYITNAEAVDTDYSVQGKLQASVNYLAEDDTIENIVSEFDWNNTFKVEGTNLLSSVIVEETTIESLDGQSVNLSCLLNANVFGCQAEETSFSTNFDETFVTQPDEIEYNNYVSSVNNNFVVSENFDVPKTATVINQNAKVVVKEVLPSIDQLTLSGYAEIKISYQENDTITNLTKMVDFSQEIAFANLMPDNLLSARVCVVEITNKNQANADSTEVQVRLLANVDAYAHQKFSVTKDLFNLQNNVDLSFVCQSFENYKSTTSTNNNLSVMLGTENLNIDEILLLSNTTFKLSQVDVQGTEVNVQGVVFANIVYKEAETGDTLSSLVSAPLVAKINLLETGTLKNVYTNIVATGLKIRSNSELELDLDLDFVADVFEEKYFEFVGSCTLLESTKASQSGISVYVTKPKDTLFSIARALCVDPQTIVEQNKLDSQEFVTGQRIYVYNNLNAEF